MMIDKAQRDLNHRFSYRPDSGNRWQIMPGPGAVQGDCEDYALTLIWLRNGKSMRRFWVALIKRDCEIWHCKLNGAGHAVLHDKMHGWTDNVQRVGVTKQDMITQGYAFKRRYGALNVLVKFILRPVLSRL